MELNPNHPTTSSMHDHWHKIAAILLARTREKMTIIRLEEIEKLAGQAITIKETADGLVLRIVSMEEAKKLAGEAGGLQV